jgi:very-short-patch-repair endonuclease
LRSVNYSYDIGKKLTAKRNFVRTGKRYLGKGPNKTEQKLAKILGPSFKYTGNGGKVISGKIPDFVNESEKIIIELYGNYFHQNDSVRKTLERINLFKDHGYDTIIIWENEVDPITVNRKLAKRWVKKAYSRQAKNQ